ncbi:MAG: ribonuclease P protein component, partial [Phycisphaerales bacterium]|nr:ribonuclease P protein component [Phycisphaerales bacterium]
MHSLHKGERLKSAALMDLAFQKGVKIKAFPVLVRATAAPLTQDVPFQAAFTVGKKQFRRAVDRNRIKRLVREQFRHHPFEAAMDLVVLARSGADQMDNPSVWQELERLWRT